MYFTINDDAIIESILSGRFSGTPDAHVVYMKYPLAWILKQLYSWIPNIPWYGIFLLCCYVAAFGTVAYLAFKHFDKKRYGVLLMALAGALWMFLPTAVILHYTVAAAALASAAIFLTAFDGPYWQTMTFAVLCYCTRQNVFFLALPFLGVVILWRVLQSREERIAFLILAIAGACGVCGGIHSLAYQSEGWDNYLEYNDARTELVDYGGCLPYEAQPEVYEAYGITAADLGVVRSYALALKGDLDAEYFWKIKEASRIGEPKEFFLTGLFKTVKQYGIWILHFTEPYTWVMICLYFVLLVILLLKKEWLRSLLVLCLGLGRNVVWIYLFWKGRFPNHILYTLILLEASVLMAILLELLSQLPVLTNKMQILCLASAVAFSCGACLSTAKAVQKQREQGEKRVVFDVVKEYFDDNPSDVFLLDIATMWDYDQGAFEIGPKAQNYFLAGGWYAGSPAMKKRFADLGVADGAQALKELDNVYYVVHRGTDTTWLENYLGSPLLVVQQIGEFEIMAVQ